jgi:dienelactone hydrolase
MRYEAVIRAARWTLLAGLVVLAARGAQAVDQQSDDQRSRTVQSKTITYQVGDQTYKGYLAWDQAVEGKRPGVLVVHEWWGLDDYARRRADQLAELGYVAFACDMYGDGKTTTHPQEAGAMASKVRENLDAWRERAVVSLDVLASQEQCDKEKLAVIGYCFGGSTALQLAYTGADLDAVVTFHAALPIPTPEEARQIKGKVQIHNGADDSLIKQETIDELTEVLNEADVDWKFISHPGAKHSFTNKDAGKAGVPALEYNAEADRKSWAAMKDLFQQVFQNTVSNPS